MVKAFGISECCKVNKCILYVEPHQYLLFKIQLYFILYCTQNMVKDLGISECSKVNRCILYVDPHQRPF